MSILLFLKAIIISTFLHSLLGPAESSMERVQLPDSNTVTDLIPLTRNQQLTSDAEEYLNAHNQIRRKKGVPQLQWDIKLAQYAQHWADQSVDECNPHHHSGGPYGENSLWEQYDERTPAMVAKIWIDEEANYDHVHKHCNCNPEKPTCMCGHYTQVVWSSTRAVGCGNATCNNELGLLIVCSYYPPGNYKDQNPFQKARPTGPHHHRRRSGAKRRHRQRGALKHHLP